jgi:hypothetical protein
MFRRKLVAIADGEDAAPGLKPEKECSECHRHRQGLEMAGRHVDDQAIDLAPADTLELVGNGLDVPVRQKRHAGAQNSAAVENSCPCIAYWITSTWRSLVRRSKKSSTVRPVGLGTVAHMLAADCNSPKPAGRSGWQFAAHGNIFGSASIGRAVGLLRSARFLRARRCSNAIFAN